MARRPVNAPYTITTVFGAPDNNALFKYHSGFDYDEATGSEVYAPISGTIRYAQMHNIRGQMVGIFDGENTHRLMHNSSLKVSVGQQVQEGQVVALSGSTGLSTGPHVHWDIIKGDKMDASSFGDFINPHDWLASKQSQGGTMASTPFITQVFDAALERSPDSAALRHYGSGEYSAPEFVLDDVLKSQERKQVLARRGAAYAAAAQVPQLQQTIQARDAEIASLKAQLASNPGNMAPTATEKQLAAEKALDALEEALSK